MTEDEKKKNRAETRYMEMLHVAGINIGVFAMAGACTNQDNLREPSGRQLTLRLS